MFGPGGHRRDYDDRELRRLDRDLREVVIQERESYGPELHAQLAREHSRVRDAHRSRRRRPHVMRAAAALLLVAAGAFAIPGTRSAMLGLFVPNTGAEIPRVPAPLSHPGRELAENPRLDAQVPRRSSLPVTRTNGDQHPILTPMPVTLPSLLDREQARLTVAQEYPALLQRRGLGGRVGLLMWVREDGTVEFPQVATTSGQRELDLAALRATQSLRFAPATRLGDPVGTWVSFSIRFQSGGTELAQAESEPAGFHIALSN